MDKFAAMVMWGYFDNMPGNICSVTTRACSKPAMVYATCQKPEKKIVMEEVVSEEDVSGSCQEEVERQLSGSCHE